MTLLTDKTDSKRILKAKIPSWVVLSTYEVKNQRLENEINQQYLLIDRQLHVEKEVFYSQFVVKLLDELGVKEHSNIQIHFDPTYEKLMIHHIDVIRDGQRIDKLSYARNQLMHKEVDLERRVYDSHLTAIFILEDIREGDILDCAYSIWGFHKILKPHYYGYVSLQYHVPVHKISQRLIVDASRQLAVKSYHASVDPQIDPLNGNLKVWSWEKTNVPKIKQESYQPAGDDVKEWVEISEYSSWQSIVDKFIPDYAHLEMYESSPELDEFIEHLKSQTLPSEQKIIQVVQFVQDKVRYLYLGSETTAYTPSHPSKVFKRRFGDCKDKTQLLRYLLYRLGVESFPCLVHTENGARLIHRLPSPLAFNHVTLEISFDEKIYWIDPTLSLQGGVLETIYFPDYEYGLLIKEGKGELLPLPQPKHMKWVHVISYFDISSDDSVQFHVKTVYKYFEADLFRSRVLSQGVESLQSMYESYYRSVYRNLKVVSPLEIIDDRQANVITVFEQYEISHIWQKNEHSNCCEFLVAASYLQSYLHYKIDPVRVYPLEIECPVEIFEEIVIRDFNGICSPPSDQWEQDIGCIKVKCEKFKEVDELHFQFSFESLEKSVATHDLIKYLDLLEKFRQDFCITLERPLVKEKKKEKSFFSKVFRYEIFIIVFFGLSLLLRWI
jgi:hypothetical protein